jgi:hypothetical protein
VTATNMITKLKENGNSGIAGGHDSIIALP